MDTRLRVNNATGPNRVIPAKPGRLAGRRCPIRGSITSGPARHETSVSPTMVAAQLLHTAHNPRIEDPDRRDISRDKRSRVIHLRQ